MNIVTMSTPLGPVFLVSNGKALCGVHFCDHEELSLADTADGIGYVFQTDQILHEAIRQLEEYFSGSRQQFDLPLVYQSTAFREKSWEALRRIPYGETVSYGDQARSLNRPKAARAVGQANHHNPLSIVIPCHRVVASSGHLTGYAVGTERKAWLLRHEQEHKSFASTQSL